jgi:hypothetical protein
MTEAISSFESMVCTRTIQRNTSVDGILHSHQLENLKSYIAVTAGRLNGDVM